jgi:8-oxo-dGTP pyrophosphatase MutT (NUDIX family)
LERFGPYDRNSQGGRSAALAVSAGLQDAAKPDIRIGMGEPQPDRAAAETPASLSDCKRLIPEITAALYAHASATPLYEAAAGDLAATSAVLVLLGRSRPSEGGPGEVCLVFNKRSAAVRQPGDLCYPGGSVAPQFDFRAARILGLPVGSLGRWPFWRRWRRQKPRDARWLALYYATALREAFEEMRLNPLRVRFIGPLPPQRLVLFRRLVYPLAAWVPHQHRFTPNREVERILRIPLRGLLDPQNYVCYRLAMAPPAGGSEPATVREVPGFRWRCPHGPELLWGATYRITISFLKIAFGFAPPGMERLPRISGSLTESYLSGESELGRP